jgi:hypothetical protein
VCSLPAAPAATPPITGSQDVREVDAHNLADCQSVFAQSPVHNRRYRAPYSGCNLPAIRPPTTRYLDPRHPATTRSVTPSAGRPRPQRQPPSLVNFLVNNRRHLLLRRAYLGGEPVKNAQFRLSAAITTYNPNIFTSALLRRLSYPGGVLSRYFTSSSSGASYTAWAWLTEYVADLRVRRRRGSPLGARSSGSGGAFRGT